MLHKSAEILLLQSVEDTNSAWQLETMIFISQGPFNTYYTAIYLLQFFRIDATQNSLGIN